MVQAFDQDVLAKPLVVADDKHLLRQKALLLGTGDSLATSLTTALSTMTECLCPGSGMREALESIFGWSCLTRHSMGGEPYVNLNRHFAAFADKMISDHRASDRIRVHRREERKPAQNDSNCLL